MYFGLEASDLKMVKCRQFADGGLSRQDSRRTDERVIDIRGELEVPAWVRWSSGESCPTLKLALQLIQSSGIPGGLPRAIARFRSRQYILERQLEPR
jgi:hypothetical protein